jgi:hypothetical protein
LRTVPGATVRVRTDPDSEVTARTTVSVPGARFEYRRTATADSDGVVVVRIAHPGTYTVDGRTVTVTDDAVETGATVTVDE